MEAFVKELEKQLRNDLIAINGEVNAIQGYDKKIELVEKAIKTMKEHLISRPFSEKEDEVQYFKYWCLPFIQLHIYYVAISDLEMARVSCDKAQLLEYFQNEKKRIGVFFSENQELYRYYRAGRCDKDELYFTFKLPSRTSEFLIADSTFCKASLVLGELLAYEEYRCIVEAEIERMKSTDLSPNKIEVKVPKAAIVEVIVPLFEMQAIWINGHPATLNELVKLAEKGLNVDLKDFSVLDNSNRYRKKSITPFLEEMIQLSNVRRERLDP